MKKAIAVCLLVAMGIMFFVLSARADNRLSEREKGQIRLHCNLKRDSCYIDCQRFAGYYDWDENQIRRCGEDCLSMRRFCIDELIKPNTSDFW